MKTLMDFYNTACVRGTVVLSYRSVFGNTISTPVDHETLELHQWGSAVGGVSEDHTEWFWLGQEPLHDSKGNDLTFLQAYIELS